MTLKEMEKLLERVEAGTMTRHEFHQQAFGMTPDEATEYGRKIDAEMAAAPSSSAAGGERGAP